MDLVHSLVDKTCVEYMLNRNVLDPAFEKLRFLEQARCLVKKEEEEVAVARKRIHPRSSDKMNEYQIV